MHQNFAMTLKVIPNTPPQGRHKHLLRSINESEVQLTLLMQVRVYFRFVNQYKNFCNFGIFVQLRKQCEETAMKYSSGRKIIP